MRKLDSYSKNLFLTSGKYAAEREYWEWQLHGEPLSVGFHVVNEWKNQQDFKIEKESFLLPDEVFESFTRMSKGSDYTLYVILLSCVMLLLKRHCSIDDIFVGMPLFRPKSSEIRPFDVLPIRSRVSLEQSFRELAKEIGEAVSGADKNQNLPVDVIAEIAGINTPESCSTIIRTLVMLENIHSLPDESDFKSDTFFCFRNLKSGIELTITYNSDIIRNHNIKSITNQLFNIFESISKDPGLSLMNVEIMSLEEKQQILQHFNNTKAEYDREITIHELFELQAERTPDNIAVVIENKELTYGELNERSNQIARLLRNNGVGQECVVGIMLDRSLEMIIGIIGILKAGGAYLPIDPYYPDDRIKYMIKDSEAKIILTMDTLKHLDLFECLVINLKDEKLFSVDSSNVDNVSKPNNMAYIIYTSGTTGKPKGAIIEHRNVVRLLFNDRIQFDFSDKDIWTMFHSFCFDFSVWEMYGALLYGGKLVIVPKIITQDPKAYLKLLRDEQVTVLNQIPSVFYNLSDEETMNSQKELSLRYVIFGGEALKPIKLKDWRIKYPDVKLINMYGITETTVHVTYKEITENEIESNVSNIGVPIPTLTTYILDKSMKLLPVGMAGELCVGGEGVGRGYIKRPELTKEKFVQNPFAKGERLYRSGDLARFLPDGDIEYLGRIDHQVKIRGFRIELGEIESQLLKNKDIKEAVVIARENVAGEKYLCAYIVSDRVFTVPEIREYLSVKLPQYMIPSYFITLDRIPLTSNGKVDRKTLPEPDGIINTGKKHISPENEKERILAAIWQEVLGIEVVSINDNFFELGGDSIKSIQVISRLQKYGMKLEMKNLFKYPIIQDLSQYVTIDKRQSEQGIVTGEVKLTPIQKWFFNMDIKDKHHFNQSIMLYRKVGFDENVLEKVFKKIVEHHDALRMVYKDEDGLIQYNRDIEDSLFTFKVIDLISESDYKNVIEKEANRLQESMDLRKGPLLKLILFKTKEGDHLLIVIHHLIVDGVSWRILFEDLDAGYRQLLNNEEVRFQIKTDSYKEWSDKLYTYANSIQLLKEKAYWYEVEETEIKPLPKDNEGEENKLKDSNTVNILLSKEETELLLKKVNGAYNTEINDILLTALSMSIKAWTKENRVLINLEGHGREEIIKDVNISRTIGWFTSMYPVLLDVEKSEDISYLIKFVKESIRKVPNKGVGYGVLKYITSDDEKADIEFKQKPEISFNYMGQFDNDIKTDIFEMSTIPSGETISPESKIQYVLNINCVISQEVLEIDIQYDKNQYMKSTIETFATYFKQNLKILIEHCIYKNEKEQTPSDIGDSALTIEEFESLSATIKKENAEWEIQASYYLSPMQEGILFHGLYNKQSKAYFEQMDLTIKGNLNIGLLEKSFNMLIERHDILRTNFFCDGLKRPRQVVIRERKIEVYYEDISRMEPEIKSKYLVAYKSRDKEKGFDLTKDILVRVSIIEENQSEFRVILSHHHIILDGWGVAIVIKELFAAYQALINNRPISFEKSQPYINYIKWMENQHKDEAEAYWNKYLEDYNHKAIVPRKNCAKVPEGEYKHKETVFIVNKALTSQLEDLAKENNATLSTIIQTVWGILLGKYNNTDDIVFGKVVSGRSPEVEGIENMLGIFINTIPVRIKQNAGQSVTDLIKAVQYSNILSERYDFYPLVQIQANCTLKQNLLDNIVVFENYPIQKEIGSSEYISNIGFEVKNVEVFEQTNYDFNVMVMPGEELEIKFIYNELFYDREFINNMEGHIKRILYMIAANSNIIIEDIDILTKEEKNRILYEFNNTKKDYPKDKTIHQLFEEQVEKTPDNIAIVYEDKRLTFKELNDKANGLARVLRNKGVKQECILGIMAHRSLELVIGMLGILKAGGAYLPIDPSYPNDRIRYMIEDSGVKHILTHNMRIDEKFIDVELLNIDNEILNINNEEINPEDLLSINSSKDLAYIMYTSGSTGNPKGTLVEHRSVVRLVKNTNYINFEKDDRILQTGASVFDASTFEIWGALLNGLRLYIVNEGVILNADELEKVLIENKITTLWLTSQLFNQLCAQNPSMFRGLRNLLVGGDILSPEHINIVREKFQELNIINGYGPTENTTFSTCYEIRKKYHSNIPIGRPISNSTAYIVDKELNLQPIGVFGELCVGGDGLSRGYLKRPDLTAEKFVTNPFEKGERLYRTGDLARWLPDGNIEFLGRKDNQVKIRGFRIELGEIEGQLLKHERINGAIVIAKENDFGEKYLCGYLVSDKELTVSEIRDHLSEELPEYMIPSYFIRIDSIPLTLNGKLDKKALPEPHLNINTGKEYVAPRNEAEEKLANIWEEVLGIEKVGIKDNFFELGGDSIKSIQVTSRLQKYGMKLEMKNLFKYPTLEELSQFITKDKTQSDQGTVTGKVKLTPIQKWFFEMNFVNKHHWNHSVMLYRKAGFNEDILLKTFKKIVEHHDALRMVYKDEDELVQYNRGIEDSLFTWQTMNLSNEQDYKSIIEIEANKLQESIDLSKGPLIKLSLFKTKDGDHLLIVIHHLVIDGVSWRILFEDLAEGYRQMLNNQKLELQDKTESFKEWSDKLYNYASSKELLKEIKYWSKIQEEEIKPLPKDNDVDERKLKDSNSFKISLSREETELLLKNVNGAYNTEINDILLTALGLAIKKWTKEDKVLINLEGHGREEIIKDTNISRTIGWFTSMYPVLLDVEKSQDISYMIKNIKENIRRIPNRGIGYGILKYIVSEDKKEELEFRLKPEISFNYLGQFDQDINTDIFEMSLISSGAFESPESQMPYALNINGMIIDGILTIDMQYNKNQYNDETIKTLAVYYEENMKIIISHCVMKEEKEQTQSDIADTDFTIEEIDDILNYYEDLEG